MPGRLIGGGKLKDSDFEKLREPGRLTGGGTLNDSEELKGGGSPIRSVDSLEVKVGKGAGVKSGTELSIELVPGRRSEGIVTGSSAGA